MSKITRRFLRYALQRKNYPYDTTRFMILARKEFFGESYTQLSRKKKKALVGTCRKPSPEMVQELFQYFLVTQGVSL